MVSPGRHPSSSRWARSSPRTAKPRLSPCDPVYRYRRDDGLPRRGRRLPPVHGVAHRGVPADRPARRSRRAIRPPRRRSRADWPAARGTRPRQRTITRQPPAGLQPHRPDPLRSAPRRADGRITVTASAVLQPLSEGRRGAAAGPRHQPSRRPSAGRATPVNSPGPARPDALKAELGPFPPPAVDAVEASGAAGLHAESGGTARQAWSPAGTGCPAARGTGGSAAASRRRSAGSERASPTSA